MRSDDDPAVLRRALDQLAGLLDDVPGGTLGNRTPCEDWSVQDLVDHIVAAPARFAQMVRGESVDWSAPTAPAGGVPIDWQCAELAVHTWDLSSALGRSTGDLDQEVAERGLAFMRASLTDDNRGSAFGPEQPAPEGADAYRRVAALAGR